MGTSDLLASIQAALLNVLASAYAYLPRVLGALAVLFIGWLLASAIRFVSRRVLAKAHGLLPTRILASSVDEWQRWVVPIVSGLVFWLILFFTLGAAFELLGFAALTGGFSGFAEYVPRVIAAVLVLLGGVIAGNLAASWITSSARAVRIDYGESVAKAVRTGIVLLASVVALAQAGIDSTLLVVALATVLGAFLGAVALAFGLGARATVANIIGAHYFRRVYKVNQNIRMGPHEGRILEIRPTGILLQTSDGVTLVPASVFNEQTSVLLEEGA